MRIENQEINQIKLISKMKICEHLTSVVLNLAMTENLKLSAELSRNFFKNRFGRNYIHVLDVVTEIYTPTE